MVTVAHPILHSSNNTAMALRREREGKMLRPRETGILIGHLPYPLRAGGQGGEGGRLNARGDGSFG